MVSGPCFSAERMLANEEVMTTRFTVGANFLMAWRIPVVPMIAGSRRSFWVS